MATILNDRDVMMRLVNPRFSPPTDRGMFLYPPSAVFKVVSGTSTPSSHTFDATLLGIEGTVQWSSTAGATLTITGNQAALTFGNMSVDTAVITASITVDGTTFTKTATVSKLVDGSNGTSPNKIGTAYLYQWSAAGVTPSRPASTSTFTWAQGTNTAYAGTDGWSITVPANPGTPGTQLFVAAVGVSTSAAATTSTVPYASATVSAWTQNGGNGASGANSGEAVVFQWAATIPSGPVGSGQLTWSNGTFGAAPTNWSLTPGNAPSPGLTLWAARVFITDSAANTQTNFEWVNASIRAVGYSGTNGTGTEGASYVTAYCATTVPSTTTQPANTTGRTSVPATNGGGLVGVFTKTVPALTPGQFLYQTDGIYNPATNTVVWSIPYWSSLKVATLSAIVANLGVITGGSIDIGSAGTSWHVDAQGNMWSGAATFDSAPFRVSNAGAVVAKNLVLQTLAGADIVNQTGLQPGFEAPGTKNSDADYQVFQRWDFNASVDGWAISSGTTTPNIYTTTFTGNTTDLYIRSGNLAVPGRSNLVRALVRQVAGTGWDGRLYFQTSVQTNESTNGAVALARPTNLGNWTVLEWDMSVNSNWINNTITRIRIDFGSVVGDSFEVDWISVGRKAPPVSEIEIVDRLRKTGNDLLTGPITLSTGGLVQIGTASDGTTISPNGIVGAKGGQVNYTQTATGDVTARSFTAVTTSGEVVLTTDKALAQQVMAAQNLAARLSSWPSLSNCIVYLNEDARYGNGEYLQLHVTTGTAIAIAVSHPLNIPKTKPYTVSFEAYCSGVSRTLTVDVNSGTGVDTPGVSIPLNNTLTRYKFTETMPDHGDAPKAVLRVFAPAGGSDIVVSNIKVEMGSTATHWTDNVITKDTIATFMQAAAIGTAFIDDLAVNNAKIANLAVNNAKIADLAVDNAKLGNAAVSTLKIGANAVTVPVSVYATDPVNGAGDGAWFDVLSTTFSMPQDGYLFALGVLGQGFGYGSRYWAVELYIDGMMVFSSGGDAIDATVSVSGVKFVSAGSHSVKVRWWGQNDGVRVTQRTLFCQLVMR